MRKILTKSITTFLFFLPLLSIAQPGALDTQFGANGWVSYTVGGNPEAIFRKIAVLPDGKFLVQVKNAIGRYNANGSLDLTFGPNNNGWRNMELGNSDFVVLPNGDFLVLGPSHIIRYNGIKGALDETFGDKGIVTIELTGIQLGFGCITLDSKGRIIVAGVASYGTDPNKIYNPVVARLNSDGTLDTDFNGGGIRIQVFLDNKYRRIVKCRTDDSDKIVAGVEVGGIYDKDDIILKYNPNGKLDLDFAGGDGEFDLGKDLDDMDVYKDGTIAFITAKTTDGIRPQIGYLNADGSYRASFTMNNTDKLGCVTFQNDGKVIVSGNGSSPYAVLTVRIGLDNQLDASYGSVGQAAFNTNSFISPLNMIYFNKRIFVVGANNMVNINLNGIPTIADGFMIALDATDVRLKCNNFFAGDLDQNTDAGKCYKTINNSRFDPAFIPSTATGTVQYQMKRNNVVVDQGTGSVNGKDFQVGQTEVTYTYTDITTQSCTFTVKISDKEAPNAKVKNITVQLNASGNATVAASDVDDGSSDPCGIQSMSLSKTSFDCSNVGANTLTFIVKDASNNTSTATVIVTIEDKVPPEAKSKDVTVYLDATGKASITTTQIDNGSNDACGIKSLSLSKTDFDCSNKGPNTVTLTVTDNNDNISTVTATITVLDDKAPIITSVIPNPLFLWPADRKMKNVTINTLFTDNCPGTTCAITNVVIKQGEFAGDNINPDWEITGANTLNLRAEIPKKGIKRIYTVTVTCTDAVGNTSTANTDVIVAHSITSPSSGLTVKAGSTVSLTGEFWDKPGNKHTAKWLIDDKSITGLVTEPSEINNGKVTGSYKFANAGVYKLKMNITDQSGKTTYANTNDHLDAIVVVYDPNGGFTYGGGYFNSPAGALTDNPVATGEASYGFTMNYFKNSTNPKGETQFEFKVGDFEFNALNFEYLVINNSMAQFKGTGKIIGGQSGIGFTMTVVDGQLDGTGKDKIRMKIYNKNTGIVFYDNQPGASDAVLPTQAVGANSSIVIKGNGEKANSINSSSDIANEQILVNGLEVKAYPNPSKHNFTIVVNSDNENEKIRITVFDVLGRTVETKNNIVPGSVIRLGEQYRTGAYFIRIKQGSLQKDLKLIKVMD